MKQYIIDKADDLVSRWSNAKGDGSKDPVNSAIYTCRALIGRHWKKKWSHWFYNQIIPDRIWTDKEYNLVIQVLQNKYKRELEMELIALKKQLDTIIQNIKPTK